MQPNNAFGVVETALLCFKTLPLYNLEECEPTDFGFGGRRDYH